MTGRDWPRPFALQRTADPSNVSGPGRVATGVIWPDGRAAMRWTGATPPPGHPDCVRQVCLWDSVQEIEAVHGHHGCTSVELRDPAVPCADLGMMVFGIVGWYGPRSRVTHWGVRWDNGGPAVTWRADPDRPVRIEQWPSGATAAFQELSDLAADEARLVWVPSDSLTLASVGSVEGRRWRAVPVPRAAAGKKSTPRR